MAISEYASGTETVGSTEWSLSTDTSFAGDAQTDDGTYQLFLELNNLAVGDTFELKRYEKVLSAATQRSVIVATFTGVQTNASPSFPAEILIHGWDYTLKKLAGTDRAISWSIRRIT